MKLVWTPLSPLTIRACHFSIASVQSNMATVTYTLHGEAVCLVEFAPLQASQFFYVGNCSYAYSKLNRWLTAPRIFLM